MQLDEARAIIARIRPRIDEFLIIRADLAELRADLQAPRRSRHGGMAELKALEARLYANLEFFTGLGTQVKGTAPLLLDLPGERGGELVLWCWLEGDQDVLWYHRFDTGIAGRRPV